MMSSTTFTTLPPGPPPEPIARITVAQYHRMIDAGVWTDDDAIELLEGWLVPKMPKKSPHRVATWLLRDALAKLLPAGWFVESQEPLTTPDSELEPDIYVAKGKCRDYCDRHPGPKDVPLVVEVADATVARDRGIKKRLYARARIAVYWIVNLKARQIEVYTDPTGPGKAPDYRSSAIVDADESIAVMLGSTRVGKIQVSDILP